MSKRRETADAQDIVEVADHFTPGEPGLYSHEEAKARAAAYVSPPVEAVTEALATPGPSDSPAGPDVKE